MARYFMPLLLLSLSILVSIDIPTTAVLLDISRPAGEFAGIYEHLFDAPPPILLPSPVPFSRNLPVSPASAPPYLPIYPTYPYPIYFYSIISNHDYLNLFQLTNL